MHHRSFKSVVVVLIVAVLGALVSGCNAEDPPHPLEDKFEWSKEFADSSHRPVVPPLVVGRLETDKKSGLWWGYDRYPTPSTRYVYMTRENWKDKTRELVYESSFYVKDDRREFVQVGEKRSQDFQSIVGGIAFPGGNPEGTSRPYPYGQCGRDRHCVVEVRGEPLYMGWTRNEQGKAVFHVVKGVEIIKSHATGYIPTQPQYVPVFVGGERKFASSYFVQKSPTEYTHVFNGVEIPVPESAMP